MKTRLFVKATVLHLLFLAAIQQAVAQTCTITAVSISNVSVATVGGNCVATFNLTFMEKSNNGNKFTTVHLWTSGTYPNLSSLYAAGTPPKSSNVAAASLPLGTVVVDNSGSGSLVTTYKPDNTFKIATSGSSTVSLTTVGSNKKYSITGISIVVPSTVCSSSGSVTIESDVWSSQAAQNQSVTCYNQGLILTNSIVAVTGSMSSCTPRHLTVSLTNNTAFPLQATYKVYADADNSSSLTSTDPAVYTSPSAVTVPASGTYTASGISYSGNMNSNLFAVATVTGSSVNSEGTITDICGLLPIELASFDAHRLNNSTVLLKWATVSEENNKGFDVQRKTSEGNFEKIGFVATAAPNGNSSANLNYQFTDVTNAGSKTEYRLAQIDLDGKTDFSPIAIVNAANSSEQSIMMVYPNPATANGTLNISFNNPERKAILISDINGKIIKSQNEVAYNYVVSGLRAGMYFIKAINQVTGKVMIEKMVVR